MYENPVGLGFVPVATLTTSAAAGPAAPIVLAASLVATLLPELIPKIGQGRAEADVITPIQNAIADQLHQIDLSVGATVDGLPQSTNIARLQAAFTDLANIGAYFKSVVSDKTQFVDGRASEQALNDIMPLIDGTGGYQWPALSGYPVDVDSWGNPTNGGRMGRISARLLQLGGMVPPPQLTQDAGVPGLEVYTRSFPYLPQAGVLPPVSPLPTLQAGVIPTAGQSTVPLLLAAGVGFLLLRSRR